MEETTLNIKAAAVLHAVTADFGVVIFTCVFKSTLAEVHQISASTWVVVGLFTFMVVAASTNRILWTYRFGIVSGLGVVGIIGWYMVILLGSVGNVNMDGWRVVFFLVSVGW